MKKLILLLLFIIVLSGLATATGDQLMIGLSDGDDECTVVYSTDWIIGSDEKLNLPSGGSGMSGGSSPSVQVNYVIGDGLCEELEGESFLVSPVDCRIATVPNIYEENKITMWLFLFMVLMFAYIIYQKKRGVY